MPRRFREDEEERIRWALMGAGRDIMGLRGARKTSIDELVRSAGIAKGSFYRFFSSKESLALQIMAEWEREFHQEIARLFEETSPHGIGPTAELLRTVFLELFPRKVMESGIQALMDPEEIAYLAQRADADQRRMMDLQDVRLFEQLRPLFVSAGLQTALPDHQIIAGLRLLFEAGLRAMRTVGETELRAMRTVDETELTSEHFHAAFLTLLRGFLSEAFRPAPTTSEAGQAGSSP